MNHLFYKLFKDLLLITISMKDKRKILGIFQENTHINHQPKSSHKVCTKLECALEVPECALNASEMLAMLYVIFYVQPYKLPANKN